MAFEHTQCRRVNGVRRIREWVVKTVQIYIYNSYICSEMEEKNQHATEAD